MTLISKHEGTASYDPATFDVDSKWLYYLTNDGSEFTRVRRYELATGKSEDVEKADWDVAWTFFSRNGRYRLSAVNEDGRSVLKVFDGKTGAPVPLPAFPAGEISSVRVSRDETQLAFQLDADLGPNNLYVYAFGARAPVRLTDTMSKDIDPQDLVDAEVVRFKSFDGMEIPNIFYRPWQASPTAKVPALVWVHGGPGGQTRQQYSPLHPVPRQPRLRGPRDQQPRQLRLRQDLLHGRRPQARTRAAVGLRRGEGVSPAPAVRRCRPHRDHRRKLRRVHGPRGAGV